jgi:hypothetical protein
VQVPLTAVPAVSGPLYVLFGLQEEMPDVASDPFQVTSTFELSQPLPFGAGLGEGVVTGGFESYFRPKVPEAVFPATSVHEPGTAALALSGPLYVDDEHDAMPEMASVPDQLTSTGWLNHAPWSGARAVPALTAGAVSSYLNPRLVAAEVLPALSVQVPLGLALAESGPR